MSARGFAMLDAPLDYIPLHIRGGYVLPTQNPKGSLNTKESREKPFGLVITLNENNNAIGDLFWDNGESLCKKKIPF